MEKKERNKVWRVNRIGEKSEALTFFRTNCFLNPQFLSPSLGNIHFLNVFLHSWVEFDPALHIRYRNFLNYWTLFALFLLFTIGIILYSNCMVKMFTSMAAKDYNLVQSFDLVSCIVGFGQRCLLYSADRLVLATISIVSDLSRIFARIWLLYSQLVGDNTHYSRINDWVVTNRFLK